MLLNSRQAVQILAVAGVLVFGSVSASANPFVGCVSTKIAADKKISACSKILKHQGKLNKKQKSQAYWHRGIGYSKRGRTLKKNGRVEQVKADIERAMKDWMTAGAINPAWGAPHFYRGFTMIDFPEYYSIDDAISAYSKAIKISPRFTVAYEARGDAYANKGQISKAKADWRIALELNPKSKHALQRLARVGVKPHATMLEDCTSSWDNQNEKFAEWKKKVRNSCTDLINSGILSGPKLAGAYYYRTLPGILNRWSGGEIFEKSLADLNKAIEIDPRQAYYKERYRINLFLDNNDDALRDKARELEIGGKKLVKTYQKTLSKLGFYKGPIDGDFGPSSRKAAKICIESGSCEEYL